MDGSDQQTNFGIYRGGGGRSKLFEFESYTVSAIFASEHLLAKFVSEVGVRKFEQTDVAQL